MPSSLRVLAVVCATGVVSSIAHAQTRLLLDRELNETYAEVVSMTADTLTIRRRGMLERTDRDEWLAILTPGEAWQGVSDQRILLAGSGAPFAINHRLALVDGQRLFGRLVVEGLTTPDTLGWSIPGFENLEIPLERILSLRLVNSSFGGIETDPADGDTVVAINADRITGFVESMGDPLQIDRGAGIIDLPWRLVREVHLVNPHEPSTDLLLWLTDGTVVAFRAGTIDSASVFRGTLALGDESSPGEMPRGPMISVPTIVVRAISFNPSRLVALSSLRPASIEALGDRRWAPPIQFGDENTAQLDAASITISGPVQCEWPLPEGAIRLAGVAMLPENARLWGDYELVVGVRTTGGEFRELLREHLHAQQVMTPFNVALASEDAPAGSIVVRVESGAYGPIQDELVLERTLILLEP